MSTPAGQSEGSGHPQYEPPQGHTSFEHAAARLAALGVTGSDLTYAASLHHQFLSPSDRTLRIGQEFMPLSLLSTEQRQQIGLADYTHQVEGSKAYMQTASQTLLVVHPMDGGTGSSVGRLSFLRAHWNELGRVGDPKLGAKGTDLPFAIQTPTSRLLIPIMEAKLLRLISQARYYAGVVWQELLNGDSHPSFIQFLKSKTITARLRRLKAQTYEQLLSKPETGVRVGTPTLQADLPTIDAATQELTRERVAPGSHGQLGTYLLTELADNAYAEETPRVHALYNGDGTNNAVSPEMVGFAVAEGAGIVMITTTRLDCDRKGGILGVVHEGDYEVVGILELAQAKKAGEAGLFQDIGLTDSDQVRALGLPHAIGEQPFNTNIALFNEGLLGRFLPRLRTYLGEERFGQVISPQLIENDKVQDGKHFTQLEGALASVILRLNALVTSDPQAQALWTEVSGGTQFLRIINLDEQQRDRYFTPIKYAWDYWMQAYSDHFTFNASSWELQNRRPGHAINVNSMLVEDPFYMDVQNLIMAFGHASVIDLNDLSIQGHVLLTNSTLRGRVEIVSSYDGIYDLTDEKIRSQFSQTAEGNLLLENVRITIDQQGSVTIQEI